jgi:hypothetical protein
MMKGSGHGGNIPDFSGTDMKFYVKDPKLKGGGFMDTLWDNVDYYVCEGVASGVATGNTYPVPSCFKDETNKQLASGTTQ